MKITMINYSFIVAMMLGLVGGNHLVRGEDMDAMWGERVVNLKAADAARGQLFDQGNYAMFIHFGLYSSIGNKYNGKDYYGIGEWIMNKAMAGIPVAEYMALAGDFNPSKFDADAIARLAKDAGMKYIVITSKHHEGFAMYHSKVNAFNIVDATPFKRDPLKELAEACRKHGLGLGFYYSHNQDWTFPGGAGGPVTTKEGKPADFKYYFENKCRPQIEEITTQYGPIAIVWFDTPGDIPKEYVEELVSIVRKNQPNALVSGRAGYGLGDYQTLGDMEVPSANVEGMWESVDTSNDSWAYAWYDNNWKSPKEILRRLIACVARGGTYMLNIGPRGDGSVPERAARSLRVAGEWIRNYPQVVYGTDPSPWKHALPWGDITRKGNTLFLCVLDMPASGQIVLHGLRTGIKSAVLVGAGRGEELNYDKVGGWVRIDLPPGCHKNLIPVIEVQLTGAVEVENEWGLDPEIETTLLAEFARVTGAESAKKMWMEKFGEWKHVVRVCDWKKGGKATWALEVLKAGDYAVELTYAGKGRTVWGVDIEGGEHIRNQQNSSCNYQKFPIGVIHFPKPGRYEVSASCLDGDLKMASLKAIHFEPFDLR